MCKTLSRAFSDVKLTFCNASKPCMNVHQCTRSGSVDGAAHRLLLLHQPGDEGACVLSKDICIVVWADPRDDDRFPNSLSCTARSQESSIWRPDCA